MCSVDNCDRPVFARGMCCGHYKRNLKYGNPTAGGIVRGSTIAWIREHANYTGDECLPWPFAADRNGFGRIRIGRKTHLATRVMCEEAHGPAPSSKHEAAHSCGKGHLGCINPNHLSWKTHIENEEDKILHGTLARGEKQGGSKLTEADVVKIVGLRDQLTQEEIARRYGVCRQTISDILRGRNWGWFTSALNQNQPATSRRTL